MEDEAHMAAVLAGKAVVNLSPSAVEYFNRFATERERVWAADGVSANYCLGAERQDCGGLPQDYAEAEEGPA